MRRIPQCLLIYGAVVTPPNLRWYWGRFNNRWKVANAIGTIIYIILCCQTMPMYMILPRVINDSIVKNSIVINYMNKKVLLLKTQLWKSNQRPCDKVSLYQKGICYASSKLFLNFEWMWRKMESLIIFRLQRKKKKKRQFDFFGKRFYIFDRVNIRTIL